MLKPLINANEFLGVVRPALGQCDAAALAHAVKVRWRAKDVAQLLRHSDVEVRRAAAIALGLMGEKPCYGSLARALHDDDWRVNEMAENAIWSILFRSGDPRAARPFRAGMAHMNDGSYDQAISSFMKATRVDPNFAEAYNQCAIAHFFNAQWIQAVANCRRAIHLVGCHFGAYSGMGHCYVELGKMEEAAHYYRRALQINPRMATVAQALERLEATLLDMLDSSGVYQIDHNSN